MSNQDSPTTLGEYIDVLRRRRIYLLTIIPAALLLSVYFAFSLPPSYRSSATVLVEGSLVPETLVQGTVTTASEQQIEIVQRRVMDHASLQKLVRESDPYPDMPELSVEAKAQKIFNDTSIERVDPVTLELVEESNAFTIHYENPNPKRAAATVQRITDLFLTYSRTVRSERASDTYEFLAAQAKDIERRITEADQRVAQFKARQGEALPELKLRNQATAEAAERDLLAYEGQMRTAEERRALLSLQLSKINPVLGGTTGNPQAEMATLQTQLADARVRYTPDHPDVKRLQRQIEALSAQAGTGSSAAVQANNPEYLAVRSQLTAVEQEIAALRSAAARARGQIYQYQSQMAVAPQIEKEYAEISRESEVLRGQYQDIQGKLREADLARHLESEQKGAGLIQIRSPNVPRMPYSPNRVGIILLGIVLGGALGIGLAALAESSDPSVRSRRDLLAITDVPAIAAIPVLESAADRRRRLVWWGSYATVVGLATLFVAITVALA